MRAAYIDSLGPAAVIRCGDLPAPTPGPGEVLVAVTHSAVNHVDTFVRSGAWSTPVPFPFVIGRDLVGSVAAVGHGVAGLAPGDRVWCNSLGHDGRQGAAAEFASVAADRLYPLPDGVDPVDAVAVAHSAATAHLALFTHGRTRAGDTVVVVGAGGCVGSAAVVMAAEAGARVIAVAGAADAEHCRELGAAVTLDYRADDLPTQIAVASPGGVDVHVDAAGRNDLESAVSLLAKRGRLVVLAGMAARPVLPVGALYLKDCSVVGFAISQASTAELAEAAVRVNRLLAAGLLRPRRVHGLALGEAAEAHRAVERGGAGGTKVVLAVTS
ncbi:NADPH:quinone reductase [Actinokineospora globicatena]|uniref:NADPH:quinone reductase n=1 Tax=Actinokineospora globicatena TaxID=103729 RepID=UPI0020A25722|nr:NADPH:quinone reductase [Actinokineospora globicatena]MCP2303168.1 NADPH:quinone reductase [Actinokineospora globicatena]GLW79715.1 oxidoreductase [Actinokineospora globicatena]GLW85875.1 oxidoreductase [Actinokineospora globicatena]